MSDCNRWWGPRHLWAQWEVIEEGDIVRGDDADVIGKSVIQKRVCTRCGFTQLEVQNVRCCL